MTHCPPHTAVPRALTQPGPPRSLQLPHTHTAALGSSSASGTISFQLASGEGLGLAVPAGAGRRGSVGVEKEPLVSLTKGWAGVGSARGDPGGPCGRSGCPASVCSRVRWTQDSRRHRPGGQDLRDCESCGAWASWLWVIPPVLHPQQGGSWPIVKAVTPHRAALPTKSQSPP